MLTPGWIRIVVLLSGGIWFLLLLLQGASAQVSWLRALGGVAGIVVLLMVGFDRFAWKWPGVHRLTKRRVLHGTWKGTLRSNWTNPKTGQGVPPIEVYLVIHQTYSETSAALHSPESGSRSISCGISDPSRGQCLLSAIYQNMPDLLIQDRSRIHHGSLLVEIEGTPPKSLKGSYWTDRGTQGELAFDAHSSELSESFEAAASLFL